MTDYDSPMRPQSGAYLSSFRAGKIRKLEKVLTDLRSGMRNLNEMKPKPYDWDRRATEHLRKLRSAESNLFRLKQGRLL